MGNALATRIYAVVGEAARVTRRNKDVEFLTAKPLAQSSADIFQMVGVTPKAGRGQRDCFFLNVNLGGDFVVVTYPWTRTQRWSGFSDMVVGVVAVVKVDLVSVAKVVDRQMAVRSLVLVYVRHPHVQISSVKGAVVSDARTASSHKRS